MPGPEIVFIGGSDTLQLEDGGKAYQPGDVMPASLSTDRRLSLQRAGIRFEMRYPEPEPAPAAKPAKDAPAEPVKEDAKA